MNDYPVSWRSLVGHAALVLGVAACATPMHSEPPADRASGGSPTRATTTASPSVDHWQAERQRILEALAGQAEVSLTTAQDGALRIVIPGADGFAKGDTQPRASLRLTLDRLAAVLAARAETEVFVVGHTDSMGSELHNLQLSIKRAEAVVEYLRTRGIALTRLHADGKGEAEPVADNGDEAGRAKNRRVEIIVRPFR